MKTLKFKEKSWHHWLATNIGNYSDEDFCAYVRSVIFGACVMAFLSAIVLVLLYCTGREVYAFYTCFFTSACTFGKDERVFLIFVAAVASAALAVFSCVKYQQHKQSVRLKIYRGEIQEPKPGFVKMAYLSIKEKTCFKLEFE